MEHLLQKHHWIADERQYFGKANTVYDFNANDPKEASRKVQKLEQTKDKLSRSVNMRAMTMLGKAEEQVGMARHLPTIQLQNNVLCTVLMQGVEILEFHWLKIRVPERM